MWIKPWCQENIPWSCRKCIKKTPWTCESYDEQTTRKSFFKYFKIIKAALRESRYWSWSRPTKGIEKPTTVHWGSLSRHKCNEISSQTAKDISHKHQAHEEVPPSKRHENRSSYSQKSFQQLKGKLEIQKDQELSKVSSKESGNQQSSVEICYHESQSKCKEVPSQSAKDIYRNVKHMGKLPQVNDLSSLNYKSSQHLKGKLDIEVD